MAGTRARGSGSGRKSHPASRRRSSRTARTRVVLAIMAAAAIAATFVWWRWRRPPQRAFDAVHPSSRLDAAEANRAALRLARGGRHLEAIPYFRAVVHLDPRSSYAHLNLSSSLGNGAQQARTHLGKTDNAVRSSVERIAMLKESIAEAERATQLATTPDERVLALLEQGRALNSWGFPLDALAQFRMALTIAPRRTDIRNGVAEIERELSTGQR